MAFGSSKNPRKRELVELLDDDMVGLFEPGIELEGKMKFTTGIVRINAHYKGEINCEGTIIVADQGELEAEIHTRAISIAGKVKGAIHASERIEIKEHGLVLGDIYTPCLVIDPGGFFDGQCHMPVTEPAKQSVQSASVKGHT